MSLRRLTATSSRRRQPCGAAGGFAALGGRLEGRRSSLAVPERAWVEIPQTPADPFELQSFVASLERLARSPSADIASSNGTAGVCGAARQAWPPPFELAVIRGGGA
jgi:hypothetical protein